MTELSTNKIWKIRTIKNYPEATNHLLVGRVLDINDSYVRLHCRSYHYKGVVNSPDDIEIGNTMVRVVPWSRIEIINELPDGFDYVRSRLIADKVGQVLFQDGKHAFPVGSTHPTCDKCEVKY
ncbi:MAG: hypothetical protein JXN61_17005 [Sedimentisphaerales bacterium]|nr:hypothetical protein [Sedimentisphaerales bacterium]